MLNVLSLALFRVAVDGGVNQILASVAKDDYDKYIPDLITGDFDSAQTHILDYYKDRVGILILAMKL